MKAREAAEGGPVKAILKLALLALPAAACSPVKVSTNQVPGASQKVARYQTYAWLPSQPKDEAPGNPFVEANLKQGVDCDLAAKAFRRVEPSQNPDFWVGWHLTMARTSVESLNAACGYTLEPTYGAPAGYGGGGLAPPGTYAPDYEQGTLILDIVDAPSNKLVWRGSAKADLGAGVAGSDADKKVHKAVDKVLAKFPPKD